MCVSVKLHVFYRFTLLRNLASRDENEVTSDIALSLSDLRIEEYTIIRGNFFSTFDYVHHTPFFSEKQQALLKQREMDAGVQE